MSSVLLCSPADDDDSRDNIQSPPPLQPIPEPACTPDPFDPASLRLASADTVGIGVKRVITGIAVNKPTKQEFVRAHPDAEYRLDTATLQDGVDKQFYLVAPPLWADLAAEIKPVKLVTAISRHGNLFLWPAVLPPPDGRSNRWHDSMLTAQDLATRHWVRVQSELSAGEYAVFQATGNLPEPEWPPLSFGEILRLAFQDRFIKTMDHPVLKALRGEV